MSEKWLELWNANYKNESDLAKFVMAKSKQTYKGDRYLPWSLMVGALYQLDPKAMIEKSRNKDGGFVFTDACQLTTIIEGKETVTTTVSHMVEVSVVFMGQRFADAYPIQDKKYDALKTYDQNMVNKAQQRCLTRVISLATGIGWSIYEQTEGQFEDDGTPAPQKPEIKSAPIVSEAVQTIATEGITPAVELAKLIIDNKDKPALVTLLGNYNEVLKKKYQDADGKPIELLLTDTLEALIDKIAFTENPDKMLKGIKKAVGA